MGNLELELIEFIRKRSRGRDDLSIGIGDDCSAWRVPAGYEEVVSFDFLVEGVHFDFAFTSPKDLAWRTAARGLSDLAACGAEPRFALLGLGLPRDERERAFEFVAELLKLLKKYGVILVGGDISRAARWTVGITVVGIQRRGKILERSGSAPGEAVYLTGPVGLAAAGLAILREKQELAARFPSLARAYLRPRPRIEQGLALATHGIASSAIDISDGLFLDAWRLAERSGVAIVIERERIPVPRSLKEFCRMTGRNIEEFISRGDDYELLFTVPRRKERSLEKRMKRCYRIGYTKEGGGVFLKDKAGNLSAAPKAGYLHFSRD